MSTDFSTLGIMQLSDSFFPTGAYTLSHGLEMLHRQKIVAAPEQVSELIKTFLENQIGPADCVAMANAYDCAKDNDISGLVRVDKILNQTRLVQQQRDSSARQGRQLVKCILEISDYGLARNLQEKINSMQTPGTYPIALAVASDFFKIPKHESCLSLLYGFTVGVLGAALRLGIISHTQSQKILYDLRPIMSRQVQENILKSTDQIWQFVPYLEIFQMMHEKLETKMFVT